MIREVCKIKSAHFLTHGVKGKMKDPPPSWLKNARKKTDFVFIIKKVNTIINSQNFTFMRVPDWLKTAMLSKNKWPLRPFFFWCIKNRAISERFKYAKFHTSFWESKGNNFLNFVTRKHYLLVKVQFFRTSSPSPSLEFQTKSWFEKGWVIPKFVKFRVVAVSSRTLAEPCVIEATSV